jgi:hypothetical protein
MRDELYKPSEYDLYYNLSSFHLDSVSPPYTFSSFYNNFVDFFIQKKPCGSLPEVEYDSVFAMQSNSLF